MNSIVWVHEEMLDPNLIEGRPAVFVFDEQYLTSMAYSLKRIGFIYECLLELDVEIRKGATVEEVLEFTRAQGAEEIVTRFSPNPWIQNAAAAMRARVQSSPPFVELRGKVDLKRFSRYWSKASRVLLSGG